MAILERSIQRWIGSSSEQKPDNLTEANAGSTFMETDTGEVVRWDGHNWINEPLNPLMETNELLRSLGKKLDTLINLTDAGL